MKLANLIKYIAFFLCSSALYAQDVARHFPSGAYQVSIPSTPGVRADLLKNIAPLVQQSIAEGYYPGAVILVSHKNKIIYRGVFGNQQVVPTIKPMRFDTIFDVASLTKVLATTPAIMQLVEQNKLNLDAPVAQYWPTFAQEGKEHITIRQLMTHTSGLAPDPKITNNTLTMDQIAKSKLINKPGQVFVYSDINFITLGYLVKIVTGESLDHYVAKHLYQPLGMKDTRFLPSLSIRSRIAPTEGMDNKLRLGVVQDPSAYALGGVSGNAGLFSDAKDIGIYAQFMLNGGYVSKNKNKKYLLGPLTILKMTSPQTPPTISAERGLGWDLDSSYSNRGILFPVNSYGHTGWTGTSIWIDPSSQTWIVILTSRTHPSPAKSNKLIEDRKAIANMIAASITDISIHAKKNTSKVELTRAYS